MMRNITHFSERTYARSHRWKVKGFSPWYTNSKLGQICTNFEANVGKSARNIGIDHVHYSRTCWEPEEVIGRKERKNLARVYVRLKSGSDMFQAGNGQALRHAEIVLVGMTADTARSRPKARLLTMVVVFSMRRKTPSLPNKTERGEGSQPVKPRARIGLQMLSFILKNWLFLRKLATLPGAFSG